QILMNSLGIISPSWLKSFAPQDFEFFARKINPGGIIIVVMGLQEPGSLAIDPITLGRLYRQHAPALRLYARQWSDSAEDLVQDAFVRLAQQAPPPERVLAWLYRVIRNQALTNYRSSARRRSRELSRAAWFRVSEDSLDAQEATRLLTELSLEMREVIVAKLWGGLTFAEISELVG